MNGDRVDLVVVDEFAAAIFPAAGGGDTRRVALFSLPDGARPAPTRPGPARVDLVPPGRPTAAPRPHGGSAPRG